MITPAQKIAALTAIKAGIDDQIKKAKVEALDTAEQIGVKSFDTGIGGVTVVKGKESVVIDDVALLPELKEQFPEQVETIERVRPAYLRYLLDEQLVIVAGEVVDKTTGEAVEWASVKPAGDDYITYPASKEATAAKKYARAWAAGEMDAISARFLELEDSNE